MARSKGTVLQNNLSRGLITEATGLNFPENAVTEAYNTVFEKTGRVTRRRGIDIEGDAVTKAYSESDGVINEFVWQAVANNGGFTFLVLQIGNQILFYEVSVSDALSAGVVPDAIDLNVYRAPGSGDINQIPCTFASGSGYLFISHPHCDPVLVRYNSDLLQFEVAGIQVLIRDYEGVSDNLAIGTNPTTLTPEHHYNLKNQGWFKLVRVGTVNNEIGGVVAPTEPDYPLSWSPL